MRTLLHYLNDFITIGPPDTPECGTNLRKLCELCAELGVPVATEKTVGPTTSLTFLGIEVDTNQLEIHLPQDKLLKIKEMMSNWMGRQGAWAGIPTWPAAACSKGCLTREKICEEDYLGSHRGEEEQWQWKGG